MCTLSTIRPCVVRPSTAFAVVADGAGSGGHVLPVDEVEQLLARQGGIARRRDVLKAGLSRRRLARMVRDGRLRLLTPHLVTNVATPAPDEPLTAAAIGLDATISHGSAALLWGMELVTTPDRRSVTVGRNRSRLTRQGVRPPGRGRQRIARVMRLVDPECGSVLESLCRVLLVQAGLGPEESQLVIRSARGRVIGRVDFAWPSARLVVEVDGFAFHADRASYRNDRRRTNGLVLAGWRVLRFSWEDVVHHPDEVVAAVRAALQQTTAHTA